MASHRRIAVLGLDCAAPRWVFESFREDLPNLRKLMEQGSYGPLLSCHPPITVPAWTCMTSGYDAGQLGIYGFRNRRDRSYDGLSLAFSNSVNRPRLWDHFDQAGLASLCIGVPQTFPITRPPRGVMISSFLTPDKTVPWISPAHLADEIETLADGDYLFDARDFRTQDRQQLWQQLVTMTDRRFRVARHLVETQPWDLLFLVEMGPDRLHHGFWRYADSQHPNFAGTSHPMYAAFKRYYQMLDEEIGRLVQLLPEDVLLLVVSDHGAKAMQGGVAVNEWLMQQGYLVLKETPQTPTRLEPAHVDWPRTRVWSEGGYYARVFINVEGREPQGVVGPQEYEALRTRLIAEMESLVGPAGKPLETKVHRPEDLFVECQGVPPDLLCYWDNLQMRSIGSVGHGQVFVKENDTGADDANHDWEGIFISRTPLSGRPGYATDLRLLDVGVSLLAHHGLPVPPDTAGKPVLRW